jgi:hypothetical protein
VDDYVKALLVERSYREAQGLTAAVAEIDAELARCGHVIEAPAGGPAENASRKPRARKALAEPEV